MNIVQNEKNCEIGQISLTVEDISGIQNRIKIQNLQIIDMD